MCHYFSEHIWRRGNLSSHGGRFSNPHDISRDCISTLSFSLLAIRPQDSPSSLLAPLSQQDIYLLSMACFREIMEIAPSILLSDNDLSEWILSSGLHMTALLYSWAFVRFEMFPFFFKLDSSFTFSKAKSHCMECWTANY